MSEDFAFSKLARAAGLRIWVHTGAKVAHIDDDGGAYLPGEKRMQVNGGRLETIEDKRAAAY